MITILKILFFNSAILNFLKLSVVGFLGSFEAILFCVLINVIYADVLPFMFGMVVILDVDTLSCLC